MKRLLIMGVGLIITVFIAAFGYFAHSQDKTNDLLIKQTAEVSDLKSLVKYKVLPKIEDAGNGWPD